LGRMLVVEGNQVFKENRPSKHYQT